MKYQEVFLIDDKSGFTPERTIKLKYPLMTQE